LVFNSPFGLRAVNIDILPSRIEAAVIGTKTLNNIQNNRKGTFTISNIGKKLHPYTSHNVYNTHNSFTTGIYDTAERNKGTSRTKDITVTGLGGL
jgi:hypothetical protein